MSLEFDVLVIGAGPAGSGAARAALARGLRVGLLGKRRFPRHKLCGGLLTKRSQDQIVEVFGAALPEALRLSKREVDFFIEGQPAGGVAEAPARHLAMRAELDDHQCRLALQAGAEDLTGCALESLDDGVVRLKDGRALRYKVPIGADGANSQVARSLFGAACDPGRLGFGLEIEASGAHVDPDARIALALESGQIAAEAAAEAIAAGRPDQALTLYTAKLRPIHRALRQAVAIRPLLCHRLSRGFFERAFRRSKTLKRDYILLLAGEKSYDDIARALIRRAPRIAWGLMVGMARRT